MDPISTSIDFDQSFSSLLKADLEKQQNVLDFDDSNSSNLTIQCYHDQEVNVNSESTTHYIKVYREQLETLQKDNFSLKLQLFYFQKAFENAGITHLPQVSEYQQEFVELEKELTQNRSSLIEAKESITLLTNQNRELQRKLSKFERRSAGSREKIDEHFIQLNQKENELNELRIEYENMLEKSSQYEHKCENLLNCVTNLENEVIALNAKRVAQTETHISHSQKLAEAEETVIFLQNNNSKIIEFAKPLAQKLQETQEELELGNLKCKQLNNDFTSSVKSNELLVKKVSDLEKDFSSLSEIKDVLETQINELLNSKNSLEQIIEKDSIEEKALICKIKNYDNEMDKLNQRLLESYQLLDTMRKQDETKESKIFELSKAQESLLQSKKIISNLEGKIEELMEQIQTLQRVHSNTHESEQIVFLNEMLDQVKSKVLEKESSCVNLERQNALSRKKLADNGSEIYKLKEEIFTIKHIQTLDIASQTEISQDKLDLSSIINQNIISAEDVSGLQNEVARLESERNSLLTEVEDIQDFKINMKEIMKKNVELTSQLRKLQYTQSVKEDLQLANLKTDQMSAQLKLIQALSQNCDIEQMNIETNKIQSAFMELADQLKVSKESLMNSIANEKRVELSLKELQNSFKLLQVEKSKNVRELSESNKQISELKLELDIVNSSFQRKLQFAHKHIKELQSLQISNPSESNILLDWREVAIGASESCSFSQNDKIYKKANIKRSSSTPCIRYQVSSNDFPQNCHNKVSDDVKPNELLYSVEHDDDDFDVIPDAIVPDRTTIKQALQSGSTNLSLLLSIYKELLTTQKYLSRAKRYTLK